MDKNFIRTATAALGLATMVGGFAACGVESSPSFTLTSFHRIKVETDSCANDDEDQLSGSGLFDAKIAKDSGASYVLYLRLENNLASNEDESSHRLNTNKIQLTEIEVRYHNDGDWSFLPKTARIPAGAIIDSGGVLMISVPAMNSTVAALALDGVDGAASPISTLDESKDLLVTFRAKGRLGDGTDVESNELDYTLSICNSCLVGACGGNFDGICAIAQPDGFTCADTN